MKKNILLLCVLVCAQPLESKKPAQQPTQQQLDDAEDRILTKAVRDDQLEQLRGKHTERIKVKPVPTGTEAETASERIKLCRIRSPRLKAELKEQKERLTKLKKSEAVDDALGLIDSFNNQLTNIDELLSPLEGVKSKQLPALPKIETTLDDIEKGITQLRLVPYEPMTITKPSSDLAVILEQALTPNTANQLLQQHTDEYQTLIRAALSLTYYSIGMLQNASKQSLKRSVELRKLIRAILALIQDYNTGLSSKKNPSTILQKQENDLVTELLKLIQVLKEQTQATTKKLKLSEKDYSQITMATSQSLNTLTSSIINQSTNTFKLFDAVRGVEGKIS